MMWGICLKAMVADRGWWDRSETNERPVSRGLVPGFRLPRAKWDEGSQQEASYRPSAGASAPFQFSIKGRFAKETCLLYGIETENEMETSLGLHMPTTSSGWVSGPGFHLCRTESDIQSIARSSIENIDSTIL